MRLSDAHNGLRAFHANVARQLRITQNRMAHASEFIEKMGAAGLNFAEMPCTVTYDEYSRSKGQRAFGAFDIVYELIIKRLLR